MENKWISVKDMLPSENIEKVLLYRKMNENQKSISITVHDAKLVKYCDEYSFWMPLPEPPTE